MKTIRIIPMMALLAIFACSANSSQKPTGEATAEGTASSAEVADHVNTPTDVRCFGLLGDVKEVRLSIREYTGDSEDDFWESKDSLQLAFDESGRIVRDNYENIYQYDAQGNFVKGLTEKSKMKRDEKGRVVEYMNWMDEEDDQGFTITFAYDAQNRMSKVNIGGWESTIDQIFTYTDDHVYPDRENCESEDEGDHYSTVITYTYKKFDVKGNWTEREAHSVAKHTIDDEPEGEPTVLRRIEQRKIVYYQR